MTIGSASFAHMKLVLHKMSFGVYIFVFDLNSSYVCCLHYDVRWLCVIHVRLYRCLECVNAVDIALILDSSSQLGGESNFNVLKQFVSDVVSNYVVDASAARIALVSFSSTATLRWSLLTHGSVSALQQAVSSLRYENGQSNIAAGLQLARESVFTAAGGYRSNVPNIAILIAGSSANVR